MLVVSGWRGAGLPVDRVRVMRELVRLAPEKIVVGAQTGVDTLSAMLAKDRRIFVHTVVPWQLQAAFSAWNRGVGERPRWHLYTDTYELMPGGTSYPDRNARMLEMLRPGTDDGVLAFPKFAEDHPLSARSGTWLTVRIARKLGLPVEIIVLR